MSPGRDVSTVEEHGRSRDAEPGGGLRRLAGLARALVVVLVAVLVVGTALWVLRSRRSAGEREGPLVAEGATRDRGGPRASSTPREVAGRPAPEAIEATVEGEGRVRGRVVDEDGAPVDEGQLWLWCATPDGEVARIEDGVLRLDEDGRFEGPACDGEVCPELRHPSRVPAQPWTVRPGVEAVLEARALPRLWGRVVDPEGNPVGGATVVVTLPPDEDDPSVVLPVVSSRTSSDEDGEFSLARIERPPCDPCQQARDACPDALVPVGDRVLVTARAPGWGPGAAEVWLDEAEEPDALVEVALRPATAAIHGQLQDAAKEPLPRAFVLARSEARSHEQHRADAGEGSFGFEALAEGPYTVRAIQDGVELWREEGVEPGRTLDLVLATAARDVELRLVDAGGRPWPDARVEGGPFERQQSDGDGRVRARRVMPGTYILRIRPGGGSVRAYDLDVPAAAAPSPPGERPTPWMQEIVLDGG